ncbi:hypothetical protein T06_7438 [Trichinella sp. T6]|nr:hypothetical protein T06_3851 [Trichinella sp. T6]KRX84551.1 hypothetical protein T06_7438 [Trichinella sp. T6]
MREVNPVNVNMASRNTSGKTRLQIIRALAHGDGKRKMVVNCQFDTGASGLSSERMWHRSSVSPVGSFVASTGLLLQSSPNDDAPVSPCRFISVSVSFVRLLPAFRPFSLIHALLVTFVKNRSRVLYARDTQVQFAKRSIDRQTRVDCMM